MIEQKLLRLEQMSSAEKVTHWSQEKPWQLDGQRLRLPRIRPFSPAQVAVDGSGNIVRMPLLLGRPCFGQVSAFLRHGGGQIVYSPQTKSWHPSRCTKCPVSKACEFVAEERLRSSPKLADLYREWRSLGGRDHTWPRRGPRGTAAVQVRELLAELRKVRFTSVRDHEVRSHYEQVIEAKLAKDRERKRRDRVRQAIEKAKVGEITTAVENVLYGHSMWRAVHHARARSHPQAPRSLSQTPPDASMFDANVWKAHTRVWLRGDTPNPYNCAAELHRMGVEQHRSINAVRDRVKRSLDRIHALERLRLDGATDPVWPRFTLDDLKEGLLHQLPTT